MDGFRHYYEQALRGDEQHDWAQHSFDYGGFKKRLLLFRQRRAAIKAYLKKSPTKTIDHSTLSNIIGPSFLQPPAVIGGRQPNTEGMYMPFMDDHSASSSSSLFASTSSEAPIKGEKSYRKPSVQRRISQVERSDVTMFLTMEMDKVAQLYLAQWHRLSANLLDCGPTEELGHEILELLAHCIVNVMAMRQSLIRYDAFVRTYGGTPMLAWYMKKTRKHQTSFRKVLFHEELNALMDTFERKSKFDVSKFQMQRNMMENAELATQKQEAQASNGQVVLMDSFLYTLRHYLLLGAIEDRMLSLEPTFLDQRGSSLTEEMRQISDWRKKPQHPPVPESTAPRMTAYECFALALNIISAFLYCMNYYIVEPSSTMYVNALGAPDYISGLLIGMMPVAALCSAVGYAVWTNYGFRMPLLASSMLLLTGNIVYASALKYHSVWIALIGRFMTGLGAPKCIIRRYMADTTPIALRTSVNAMFALAIAVGSALGPAMAILLSKKKFVGYVPVYGHFAVNAMTGPGYFMALVWFIYTLTVAFTFSEPHRAGLEEQKLMEQAQAQEQALHEQGESSPASPESEQRDDDLKSIFSTGTATDNSVNTIRSIFPSAETSTRWTRFKAFLDLITPPVRLCLLLLFAKTFTIESLVSCTSALTKNRYGWVIHQVGILGCINGLLVVPLSITIGYLSVYYQDRVLMTWLVAVGALGMFLLVDVTDLLEASTDTYNEGVGLAVDPKRYVAGYFLTYISIQSFEGVIGSVLSKVIPTALASGTFNSGLLATLVDTLGRASGDFFISFMGWVSLRQLMNLLFIPAFCILMFCLFMIRRNYDLLAV